MFNRSLVVSLGLVSLYLWPASRLWAQASRRLGMTVALAAGRRDHTLAELGSRPTGEWRLTASHPHLKGVELGLGQFLDSQVLKTRPAVPQWYFESYPYFETKGTDLLIGYRTAPVSEIKLGARLRVGSLSVRTEQPLADTTINFPSSRIIEQRRVLSTGIESILQIDPWRVIGIEINAGYRRAPVSSAVLQRDAFNGFTTSVMLRLGKLY